MTTDKRLLIKVEGLEKSFGKLEVLKGIDTEIYKGDVVVVIGPSGSGKSTFLRTLNLLEQPTGGKIFFEGVNITDPEVDINVHRQNGNGFPAVQSFPPHDHFEKHDPCPHEAPQKEQGRGRGKGHGTA